MAETTAWIKKMTRESEEAAKLQAHLRTVTRAEIVYDLRKYNLNTEGSLKELRERLLRFGVKLIQPLSDVPWDPEVDERRTNSRSRTTRATEAAETSETDAPVRDVRPRRPAKSRKTELAKPTEIASENATYSELLQRLSQPAEPSLVVTTLPATTSTAAESTRLTPVATSVTTTTQTSTHTTPAGDTMTATTSLQALPGTRPTSYVQESLFTPGSVRMDPRFQIVMTNLLRHYQEAVVSSSVPTPYGPNTQALPGALTQPDPVAREQHEQLETDEDRISESSDGDELPRQGNHSRFQELLLELSQENLERSTPRAAGKGRRTRRTREQGTQTEEEESAKEEERKSRREYRERKNEKYPSREDTQKEEKSNKKKDRDGDRERRRDFREEEVHTSEEESSESGESTDSDESEQMFPIRTRRVSRKEKGKKKSNTDDGLKCIKMLQSWNLKFAGDDREGPEDFLARLEDCRESTSLPDADLLNALPCTLTKGAGRWYRAAKKDISSWKGFKKAFRNQFIGSVDREDLLEDLRVRTQAKGETIAHYVSCIKHILGFFKRPPSKRKQLETAYRNLLPEYRQFMSDKIIDSFESMERLGRRWEKQKALDRRYTPPPPKEKMTIPGAAFIGPSKRAKVAAVREPSESRSSSKGERGKPRIKEKKATRKKVKNVTKTVKKKVGEPVAATTRAKTSQLSQKVTAPESPTYAQVAGRLTVGPPGQPWQPFPTDATGQPEYRQREWRGNSRNYPKARATWQPGTEQLRNSAAPQVAVQGAPGFPGACFYCQQQGHRAAECPKRACFFCHKAGHQAARCPEKQLGQPENSCQVCGSRGTIFAHCKNCEGIRQMLGNGAAGVQNRPLPPA